MQRYLENLRKKPKAVRAQVAFLAAGGITTVFFLIWAVGLDDRLVIESPDPTIAQFQREAKENEIKNRTEALESSGLFSQIKRGVAAVIFNDPEPTEEEKSLEAKVIDINAMINNPQPRQPQPPTSTTTDDKKNDEKIKEDNSATIVGSVILIGTSTNATSSETIN